ncbi:MAG TPA: ROK family protein [Acidimicrobiia bacterium]
MSALAAGIDIGGSGTKACLVADTKPIGTTTQPTEMTAAGGLGDLVITALKRTLSEAGRDLDQVTSIGIGVPGQVNDGVVRHAANLGIDETGFDLGGYVSSATQVATFVENDMRVAAYGAYTQSVSIHPAMRNLVYVGLGTGVSAGVVINGEVFRGSRGLAGEFGHVPMGTGIVCVCGSVGCLETVIGATALGKEWQQTPVSSLFQSAAGGDMRAAALAARAIDHLAKAMWWLAATYDPDLFYLGGGVGIGAPSIMSMVAARWAELEGDSELARRVLDPSRIRMYDLEEPVGAYGAALLGADLARSPG